MASPCVSILVNCYNGERFLTEALESIFNQSFQDFEVLFVDNCSVDKSAQIAQSYGPKLRYLKTPELMSLYSARAFALPFVRGTYFTVLDSDDLWHPRKLETQVRLMEQRRLDFIFSNYHLKWERDFDARKVLYGIYDFFRVLKGRLRPEGPYPTEGLLRNYSVNLQTIMLRWSVVQGLNFNTKLNLMGDFDLFFKLFKDRAVVPYYLPRPLATTRLHPQQLTLASARNWLKEARYVLHTTLRGKLSAQEKKDFQGLIDVYRYRYLLSRGDVSRAQHYLRYLRFKDIPHFLRYLKSLTGKVS